MSPRAPPTVGRGGRYSARGRDQEKKDQRETPAPLKKSPFLPPRGPNPTFPDLTGVHPPFPPTGRGPPHRALTGPVYPRTRPDSGERLRRPRPDAPTQTVQTSPPAEKSLGDGPGPGGRSRSQTPDPSPDLLWPKRPWRPVGVVRPSDPHMAEGEGCPGSEEGTDSPLKELRTHVSSAGGPATSANPRLDDESESLFRGGCVATISTPVTRLFLPPNGFSRRDLTKHETPT